MKTKTKMETTGQDRCLAEGIRNMGEYTEGERLWNEKDRWTDLIDEVETCNNKKGIEKS